ncbi:amino acid permease [Microbacterium sp. HD4P20]|uniref:APC family permease n=1 Tax=Microbacterium sp. HD4P20 TaxID=2864874 RepID=UPI001C6406C0|nr:amino acid permease [Microbacterium sp. HD4P20]MCP2637805.1 amino acid permease [Microbacterium sp. HD4P20]
MASPSLQRRLGLTDAVFIGLGAMIGAGVFAVWAPAADAAGAGLLIGLAIAAVVAFGNATSSAQLAAAHPTSGGTYAYGRAELGPWWGFTAGWGFVIGKTASCAAMALTFAAYAAPPGWERPVALAAVAALTIVNWFGVTRTAQAARVIVVAVLLTLAVGVAASVSAPDSPGWLTPDALGAGGVYGTLQSAGLLFFAFAGYARIATLGEEVRDPQRLIPRAIVVAFAIALALYVVVAIAVLSTLGPDGTAASAEPVADAAVASGWGWAGPVVRIGAAAASLGALLALIAGVSRTTFAMARERDLPVALATVHPRWHVPHRAELAVAVAVLALVAFVDLRGAIGFSSFGVLLYYLVANVAAFRQRGPARRYPAVLQVIGGVGCLVLAVTLPWQSVVAGVIVVAVGIVYRAVRVTRAA